MRLQDHALDDKPAIAQLADVLSRHFILVLLIIAAAVWTFWHFMSPSGPSGSPLAVLVATCPCALSLATPTALTSATANLTRSGILLRRGHVLDILTRANRIVMDKTGTLTTGNISLVSTQPSASSTQPAASHSPMPWRPTPSTPSPVRFKQTTGGRGAARRQRRHPRHRPRRAGSN